MPIDDAYAAGVKLDNIYWSVCAEEHSIEEYSDGSKLRIISLSWGWTAGQTAEESDRYADDAPRGEDCVLTTEKDARKLLSQLRGLLEGGHELA